MWRSSQLPWRRSEGCTTFFNQFVPQQKVALARKWLFEKKGAWLLLLLLLSFFIPTQNLIFLQWLLNGRKSPKLSQLVFFNNLNRTTNLLEQDLNLQTELSGPNVSVGGALTHYSGVCWFKSPSSHGSTLKLLGGKNFMVQPHLFKNVSSHFSLVVYYFKACNFSMDQLISSFLISVLPLKIEKYYTKSLKFCNFLCFGVKFQLHAGYFWQRSLISFFWSHFHYVLLPGTWQT